MTWIIAVAGSGDGDTTASGSIGFHAAIAGYRTLIVDFNPGGALADAFGRSSLMVADGVVNVRHNLDLVQGLDSSSALRKLYRYGTGAAIEMLNDVLAAQEVVPPTPPAYDLVLINAPDHGVLSVAAMRSAEAVLVPIPMKPWDLTRVRIATVSVGFVQACRSNEMLRFAGFVLIATAPTSKALEDVLRTRIEEMWTEGPHSPVFKAVFESVGDYESVTRELLDRIGPGQGPPMRPLRVL